MLTLFIILVVLILAWGWVGFPLLLLVWRGRREIDYSRALGNPRVSIIIAAYNEESVIEARLQNLTEIELPPDTEVLIGCDGCDDQTVMLAQQWIAKRNDPVLNDPAYKETLFKVMDFAERRGKPAVLKDLVAASVGDILLFSDANTMFAKDAVTRLLAPLSDRAVGGSCGRLVLVDAGGCETSENVYWRFETWLKTRESQLDSCLGANGAVYAVRRELFWERLPATTIVDDFVIGMKVREVGRRLVYVPEAVATEDMPSTVAHEWRRRTRIGAGAYQALVLCRRCLLPRYGRFAVMFMSHKVLRWFTPHLMLGLLVLTVLSLDNVVGRVFFVVQALFYAGGLMGWLKCGGRLPRVVWYFLSMQAALLAGFWRWLRSAQQAAWARTERRL